VCSTHNIVKDALYAKENRFAFTPLGVLKPTPAAFLKFALRKGGPLFWDPFPKGAAAFLEIKIPLKQRWPLFWDPFAKGAAAFLEIKIPLKQRRPLFGNPL
jgi:hypothetical protein